MTSELPRLDDLCVLDQGLEVADARLHLSLLLLGGVVVAVLGEVAQLPGGFDLASDVDSAAGGQLLELFVQPVVRGLGKMLRVGHGPMLPASWLPARRGQPAGLH